MKKLLIILLIAPLLFGSGCKNIAGDKHLGSSSKPVVQKEKKTMYQPINEKTSRRVVRVDDNGAIIPDDALGGEDAKTKNVYRASAVSMNYLDNGTWYEKDMDLKEYAVDDFAYINGADEFDVFIKPDGTIKFYKDNEYVLLTPKGSNSVEAELKDGRLTFKNKWEDADFIERMAWFGIKTDIILNSDKAPLEFEFDIETNLDIRDDLGGIYLMDGTDIVMEIKEPFAEDKRGITRTMTHEIDKGIYKMTLDATGLQYPIIIDPTVSASPAVGLAYPVDCPVFYNGAARPWNTIRLQQGTDAEPTGSNSGFGISQSSGDNYDTLKRIIFLFDVSSITDTDTIDEAQLSIYAYTTHDSYGSGLDSDVHVVTTTPDATTNCITGDFQYTTDNSTSKWGDVSLGSISSTTDNGAPGYTINAYKDIPFTRFTEISKTTTTLIGIRLGADLLDIGPQGASTRDFNLGFRMVDNGSDIPILFVTSSAYVAPTEEVKGTEFDNFFF